MYCPECGKPIEDEKALFCPNCGTALKGYAAPQPEAEQTAPEDASAESAAAAETPATAPVQDQPQEQPQPQPAVAGPGPQTAAVANLADKFKALDQKVRYGIIGGVAALLVIVLAAIVVPGLGGISTDAAKQAFMETSLFTDGAVPSTYTNDTAYEVKDFHIDRQEDTAASYSSGEVALVKGYYGVDELKTVTCSGKMANESFETEFTVMEYFGKSGNDWIAIGSPDTVSTNTVPIKGVDYMENTNQADNEAFSVSDYEASLDQNNGIYTSKATQKATYEFWFAKDTATNSRTFTFSSDKGWVADGDIDATDTKTEWSLSGKTFTISNDSSSSLVERSTSTIAFVDGENADTITANYTIKYTPDGESDEYNVYTAVDDSGSVSGTPKHEFGEEDFTVELNNGEKGITITCENANNAKVAGSGTVNAMNVDIATKLAYRTVSGLFNYTNYYEFTNATYTQNV